MPKMRADNQIIEKLCTECIMSVKYSLDAFAKEDEAKQVVNTGLTEEENFLTTAIITRQQTKITKTALDMIDKRHFRQKQKMFLIRLHQFAEFLDTFEEDLKGEEEEQVRLAKGIIKWLENSHKIMLESSSRKTREANLVWN
tara:strand:- start:748 stop:1173 length:426 start_codon:yes stop_codon:yes gene_type:complete